MKKVDSAVMRAVEGGATYRRKCSKCGKTYSASYSTWLGYVLARKVVFYKIEHCKH